VRQAELNREAETCERVSKVAALKAETEAQTILGSSGWSEKTRLRRTWCNRRKPPGWRR
jgi:hypothetical protein